MALFKNKKEPIWFTWLVIAIGVVLIIAQMDHIPVLKETWGPILIVLWGLKGLLMK